MKRTEAEVQADMDNLYRSVAWAVTTLISDGKHRQAFLLCENFGWAVPVDVSPDPNLVNDTYQYGSTFGGSVSWSRRGGTRFSYRCRRSWCRNDAWSDA